MSKKQTSRHRRPTPVAPLLLAAILAAVAMPASAQPVPPREAATASAAVDQSQPGAPAALVYANRPIARLRSSFLGRPPDERARAARTTLDRLIEAGVTGPVTTRPVGEAVTIEVDSQPVFAIMPADVDPLTGETVDGAAAAAARRLEVALNEVSELRRPRQLLIATIEVLAATALFVALIWALVRIGRAAKQRIRDAAERRLGAKIAGSVEFMRTSRIIEFPRRIIAVALWSLALFLAYSWLTFALRRFPYTRPWGESLRTFLFDTVSHIGVATLEALPGLFTVLLFLLITRFVTRIVQLFFHAVEEGRVSLPWVYPETAQSTRKLLTVGLWLFAATVAYPYLPGSGSEAFKGMSVFIGLVVSLGSSGIVNQVMSGFTLTYSRALRVGDFVKVGDIEGKVTQVGTLSTKIKTIKGEDVTIPNGLVVSQTVTNYSRFADTEGVFVPTEITIGYDVPWRQVEALLLLAAARTAGVRREPAPRVRQSALEDAYIRYTLLFCPENPAERHLTTATVHAHILDAFNEYGVQITSPNYEADPAAPKIVPREQWYSAPAAPSAAPIGARDVSRVVT